MDARKRNRLEEDEIGDRMESRSGYSRFSRFFRSFHGVARVASHLLERIERKERKEESDKRKKKRKKVMENHEGRESSGSLNGIDAFFERAPETHREASGRPKLRAGFLLYPIES